MAENNEIKDNLEKTIDTLFSETPGAPVSLKKAESAPAPKAVRTAPKPEPVVSSAATPAVKPAAPIAKAEPKPEAKAEVKAEVKAEAKPEVKAEVKTEAKPESAPAPTQVKKNVPSAKAPARATREPKPIEKEPVWAMILTVCALILCLSIAGIAVIACYFYFGPGSVAAEGKPMVAYFSMIMCVVVCAVFVGFFMGSVFMLRKIEKDIREIKSKL